MNRFYNWLDQNRWAIFAGDVVAVLLAAALLHAIARAS